MAIAQYSSQKKISPLTDGEIFWRSLNDTIKCSMFDENIMWTGSAAARSRDNIDISCFGML